MKYRKKILVVIGVMVFFIWGIGQTAQDFIRFNQKAVEALGKKDYRTALGYFQQMVKIVPGHPRLHYRIARLQALLGEPKRAIRSLSQALNVGYVGNADNENAFKPLLKLPEFQSIIKKIQELKKPVHKSERAFSIKENELIPEGITYDPVKGHFYLGSTYLCKIIRIEKNGNIMDFAREKQDDLRTVLGMKVDARRKILWVNSAVGDPPPKDVVSEEIGWSGLFKYDLINGKLIKKYTIHRKGEQHLFNDLVFTSQGDVYITDSEFGVIYTVNYKKDQLELFLKSDKFIYPNGIAVSPDEKTLYMAHSGGIVIIDIGTREYSPISYPKHISLNGLDGLYYYRNSLIAVQNGLERICRFFLNRNGDTVERYEILEANNPRLDIPTTGVVVGNRFYYIANCALRAFNTDGSLDKGKLKDIIILKVSLNQED